MNTAKIACNLSEDMDQIAVAACSSGRVKAYVAGIFGRIKNGRMPGFRWDHDTSMYRYTKNELAEMLLDGIKDKVEWEDEHFKTVDELARRIMTNVAGMSSFHVTDTDGVNAGLYDLVCEEAGLDPREVFERENMYGEF